ncbi:MAG: DNA gyrase/topoisomerase IV subunit A [Mangrovibacterium sp.]
MSEEDIKIDQDGSDEKKDGQITYLSGMYQNWFLDYASYVILERAVPYVNDGLKPVQRRILHAMREMDDGRYNKVANIIGQTMMYHPHGDASIGDALVQLGQKDLLIDTQGNWGNILTGDSAAAPRYIEARLSKFALDVVFNPKTTKWQLSYDGRNREPITLPVKFPLLLAQGVEGIAVGLASKILPHNFIELIDASVACLKGEDFELYPDFPTGGAIDILKYNDGLRGGVVKVRAKIEKQDAKTLVITELPYGRTTSTLIESIIKANDKNKIKIKRIDDNTSDRVEILVHLASGVSSDKTIDALYAFTDCEISVSPNACIIENDKPLFLGVKDILKKNTSQTVFLLKLELEIRKEELQESLHFASLEKIFIEERIYKDKGFEQSENMDEAVAHVDKRLEPWKPKLIREVTREDILKLMEIRMVRILKFNSDKAEEYIQSLYEEIEQIEYHIAHIIEYAINYFERIKAKYGKGKERKTEIRSFDNIVAAKVAVANEKLYIDREEGFMGTSLKKAEYVCDCSDMDDVIVFRKDGTYFITKVTDKAFIGKNIEHLTVFKKNDNRTIYNVVYRDGRQGNFYMKRFAVTGVTRDKEYDVTRGTPGSRIWYFSANPNGEAEVLRVTLKPRARMKRLMFETDFGNLAIKGRDAMGNILTKFEIHRIVLKEKGISTLGGRKIWFDPDVLRLNSDGRGNFLGEFQGEDQILVMYKNGEYQLYNFDLSNHFDPDILSIEKYRPGKVISAVYYDAEQAYFYVKRFEIEEISGKRIGFIGEHSENKLISVTWLSYPRLEIQFGGKNAEREAEIVEVADFIGIKSYKARGKRLTNYEVKNIQELEPVIRDEDNLQEPIEDEDAVADTDDDIPFEVERPSDEEEDTNQMKLF